MNCVGRANEQERERTQINNKKMNSTRERRRRLVKLIERKIEKNEMNVRDQAISLI